MSSLRIHKKPTPKSRKHLLGVSVLAVALALAIIFLARVSHGAGSPAI